jgi:TonB-linked SusC/RagA family outer membrane protein
MKTIQLLFNRPQNSYGKSFLLTLFLSLALLTPTLAQQVVSGRVSTVEGNEALEGASIVVKGTRTGALTDQDGNYKLTVPEGGETLLVSFIGYSSQEIAIAGRSTIDVQLAEDIGMLEEVIVTGYGTQKKVNLSGAVDKVSTEGLESRPLANLAQGLQGASPNLNIDFNSGEPGQVARINIRGFTSINGGEPLILIDNIPSDAAELNRISPDDIASISVLKDASSAAIYGARAAFGVILITTKNGANERPRLSYTGSFMAGTPTVLPQKITDPYIYLRVRETSTDNTPWDNQNYTDETYAWAKERSENPSLPGVRENPNAPGTWEYMGDQDWTQYFLNNYTYSQNHALSISGGNQAANYFLSGSYNRNNGALTLNEDYFDRYTLRSKTNFMITDWLTVGNNTYITNTDRVTPSYFSIWDLYNFHPTDMDKNPDGTWANNDVGVAGARLTDGGMSQERYNSFQTTFTGQVDLIPNTLKINGEFTARRGNTDLNTFYTKYNIGYGPGDVREEGNNSALRRSLQDRYNVLNVFATFTEEFGNSHQLTAIAGFNQESFRREWFQTQRDGIISASLPTIALATGDPQVTESVNTWAVRGAFYRLNYILMDRYIFEFNGRYDGSSRFPQDKRFGFFPSASVAWRLDKEAFMDFTGEAVSLFKIRGSYGSLGNQFVDDYGYIPTMTAQNGNYIIGDKLPQRVTPPSLVSPNYTWENVTSLNLGVDLGLFADRLIINADWYQRNTIGMLTQGTDLPDVLGADEPAENAADLQTKGWDLSVAYRNQTNLLGRDFNYDFRVVLSDNRSFITRFDNPNNNLTQFYEGQELGEIWGLTSDGFFVSEEEINQLDQSGIIPWGALSIVPGWPKYVDQDGNGVIEKGLTTDDPKDLSVIGNITPRYRYGANINLEWAGIDLGVFVQGVGRRDYYPLDYLYWGFYQQPYAGGYAHLLDFYRPADDNATDLAKHSQSYIDAGLANANTDAQYPILQSWMADRNLGERIDEAQGLAIPQTGYMLNAAYLRLKNVTLGYTLPNSLTNKIKIDRIRIYVTGENLTEWSQVSDFFDPEAISDIENKYNPSVSPARGEAKGYAYPFQRRFAAGVNVNF